MKTFSVTLPDGRIIENIPEGTTKSQIAQKVGIAIEQPSATQQPSMKEEALEGLKDYRAGLVGASGGFTGGFNDEIAAGLAAAGSVPVAGAIAAANALGANMQNPNAGKGIIESMESTYNSELEKNRAQNKAAMEGREIPAGAGAVLGAILSPMNKVLPQAKSVGSAVAQGGGLGAIYGFGEGEGGVGNRIVNSLKTGAMGAATGAAFGLGQGAANYIGKKINPAPSINKMKEISDKAFKYIKDSEFKLSAIDTSTISKAMDDVIPKDPQLVALMQKNGSPILKNKALFDEIYAGKPVTLDAFKGFDAHLGDDITKSYQNFSATSDTKALYELQNAMRSKMDDAMQKATPSIRDAYFVYSQQMKTKDLGDILDRAMLTQNPATSLKTQLSGYLRKSRGLDDKEKELLRKVIDDDMGDEFMRVVGSRLAGIGQVAQGNFGNAMGQVALSKLARNSLEAGKLQRLDDLTDYIGRRAGERMSKMNYLDVPKKINPYPKMTDEIPITPKQGARGNIKSSGIRPSLKTNIEKKDQ